MHLAGGIGHCLKSPLLTGIGEIPAAQDSGLSAPHPQSSRRRLVGLAAPETSGNRVSCQSAAGSGVDPESRRSARQQLLAIRSNALHKLNGGRSLVLLKSDCSPALRRTESRMAVEQPLLLDDGRLEVPRARLSIPVLHIRDLPRICLIPFCPGLWIPMLLVQPQRTRAAATGGRPSQCREVCDRSQIGRPHFDCINNVFSFIVCECIRISTQSTRFIDGR
jgi:hypothetical protein